MNEQNLSAISSMEKTDPKQHVLKPAVWQKPSLQRLRVNLDTALSFGSGGDGMMLTSTGP